MKLLDLITTFHNWLTDKDFVWWPFSFLRPEKNEPMTMNTVMLMTACFGGLAFLMFTVFMVMNNVFTIEGAISTFFMCLLSFLIWFSLVTKPLWNRRAHSLQKKPLNIK